MDATPNAIFAALANYAALGLRVFPVHTVTEDGRCTCNKECGKRNVGKHPRIADWQKEASSKLEKMIYWWKKWPGSNIGVVTGPSSGGFVVDIDKQEAWDSLNQEMPATFTYITGGGGRHLWFEYPKDLLITNSSGTLPNGIDIRGTGGFVLMPPSRTPKGGYRHEGAQNDRLEAPEWLLQRLRVPERSRGTLVPEKGLKSFGDLDSESQDRYRRYTQGVVDSETETLQELNEGSELPWNNTTYNSACNLFELAKAPWSPLLQSEAEDLIRNNAPPFDDEGWNEEVLNKLIDSAFKRIFHNTGVRNYPSEPTTPRAKSNGSKKDEKDWDKEPPKALKLIPASQIEIQKVEWLWNERIALGEMGLLAGREGIGKSVISIWIAAQVSRGLLPGEFFGQPRNVLYLATEDSWNKTIAPRLLVAGADMEKVFREDLEEQDSLYLPRDTVRLALTVKEYDIALLVMDPLMSYVGAKANTYSGREVRAALEPIVKMCHDYNAALLGLIHFNKTSTDDILNRITDSKAFTQLTRTVTVVERDESTDEKNRGLIDTVKNNLGRLDLPAISYKINGAEVMTNKGLSTAPALEILGDVDTKVEDLIREHTTDLYRGQTKDAAEWLSELMDENDGAIWVKDALKEGQKHDFKDQTLRRALKRLKYKSQRMGGSDVGFAWFKDSMTREEAREILERRNRAIFAKDKDKMRTDLDF